jgi:DNA polymerase III subunit epsilon
VPIALDTPVAALRFLVVDVETTGMRALWDDRVTEFAAVAVEGGATVPVLHSLVNPGRPIPERITALTGITDRMVRQAPTFSALAPLVREALDDRVFVAHNATFDWSFISAELARTGEPAPETPQLCTVRLARRVLPFLPRRSLDHVTAHYGVHVTGRHRADGDAVATAAVLRRLLADTAPLGVETWGDLVALTTRGTGAARKARRSFLPRPMEVDPLDPLT